MEMINLLYTADSNPSMIADVRHELKEHNRVEYTVDADCSETLPPSTDTGRKLES